MSAPAVNEWATPSHVGAYLAMGDAWPPHRAEGEAVLLAELPTQVERVLDLGCGDGRLLERVLEARPGAEGVALDFSDAMLDAARARFAGRHDVNVVRGDLATPLDGSAGRALRCRRVGPRHPPPPPCAQAGAVRRGAPSAPARWAVRQPRARGVVHGAPARPLLRAARRGRRRRGPFQPLRPRRRAARLAAPGRLRRRRVPLEVARTGVACGDPPGGLGSDARRAPRAARAVGAGIADGSPACRPDVRLR